MNKLKKPKGSKKNVFIKIIKTNAINILYLNSPNIKKKPKRRSKSLNGDGEGKNQIPSPSP